MNTPAVDITIIVILDKSGSMKVSGDETMEALRGFLDGLPQVSIDIHKISKRLIISSFNENVSQENRSYLYRKIYIIIYSRGYGING